MSERRAMWVTTLVMAIALLALTALVAFSPHHFIYDEPYYLNYVSLLHQHGWTLAFINSVPGPAGPLYAFVHAAAEPVTKLDPVGMRLVNVSLLLGVMVILGAYLRLQKQWDFWARPLLVLVVPMTWVLSGVALTEAPALLLVTLSLYFLLRGLEAFRAERPVWRNFLASAVLLGIAVWGRQPYLLLAGIIVLLALVERRLRAPAVMFLAVVLAVVAPLFIVWHGLVPPAMRRVQGLSLTNGLLSLSYTGICVFLLAPRFFRFSPAQLVGLVLLSLVSRALCGVTLYPLMTVAQRLIPARLFPAYGQLCGVVFLCVGLFFLASALRALWAERNDLRRIAVYSGLIAVSLSPLFVAHQYSSRYTGMALPFLILAADGWRRWQTETLLLSAAGAGMGALSLFSYLYM
jgi:hypothetical protein